MRTVHNSDYRGLALCCTKLHGREGEGTARLVSHPHLYCPAFTALVNQGHIIRIHRFPSERNRSYLSG